MPNVKIPMPIEVLNPNVKTQVVIFTSLNLVIWV
jgi:hypothetical protein